MEVLLHQEKKFAEAFKATNEEGDTDHTYQCYLTPNQKIIAFKRKRYIYIYSFKSGKLLQRIYLQNILGYEGNTLNGTPNSQLIFMQLRLGVIFEWDCKLKMLSHKYHIRDIGHITSLVLNSSDKFWVACFERKLCLLSITTKEMLRVIQPGDFEFYQLWLQGNILYGSSYDTDIYSLDVNSDSDEPKLVHDYVNTIAAMQDFIIHEDGQMLIEYSPCHSSISVNRLGHTKPVEIKLDRSIDGIRRLLFSRDYRYFIARSDNTSSIFECSSLKKILEIPRKVILASNCKRVVEGLLIEGCYYDIQAFVESEFAKEFEVK